MDLQQAGALAAAGLVAGTVNTIAGAGSLLTFPALLAAGLPPLAANVTNCLGVVPGSVTGAYGMRSELTGLRGELVRLSVWAALGAVVGAVLLLSLPSAAFDRIVPVLVGAAGVLVLAQPYVLRALRREPGGPPSRATGPGVAAVSVYSGYFGAAQGVLFIGALGVLRPTTLKRTNAVKNVLSVVANTAAGTVYAVVAPVHWPAALLLAVGSAFGGPVGARLAKVVPPGPLRLGIAAVALFVAVRLALTAW
ncbi:MAG: sulfite exporter TauE/SafE family protein [Actinomycetota bacterium]|nr:sulfite exporter TauE/SafE family protein [Actinomycetota bacterium]